MVWTSRPSDPVFALVRTMQILSSYKEEGFGFLLKVFNNSDYLEQVTGLHSLYTAAERADVRHSV